MDPEYTYVIWSFEHRAWWKPNQRGYTTNLDEAGGYSAREAGQIVTDSVLGEEVAILFEVAQRRGAPTVRSLWDG